MCGISCIVTLSPSATRHADPKSKSQLVARLHKSFDYIRHRGPDSSGHWISEDGRIALGHVRLEINDLSPTGAQPLHHYPKRNEPTTGLSSTSASASGGIHAVVNGEIYDYPRLRAEMEDKIDYRFQGTSDCELVLALYKYYGLSFLSHLRGEFSLCLYDTDRELFVAVRDRYGIKPLFWRVDESQRELWVAAEQKAFLGLGWRPRWDVPAIVGGDFQMGERTVFHGVQKVLPGHALVLRHFDTPRQQVYWDLRYPDKHTPDPRSDTEMIAGVRERLLDAVRQRLHADVKVGVSLSGGLDSSVVAGMVNHLLREGHRVGSEPADQRLSCFGIAFDADSGFDESLEAEKTAEWLGVKFHKKKMDEAALADMFEDATWCDEGVNPDLNFIGVFALSELFREKGFRVNVNGQGSDEVFSGYNIFLPDYLREPDETIREGPRISDEFRNRERDRAEKELNEVYGGALDLSDRIHSVARRQLGDTLTPSQMALAYPPLPFRKELLPANGQPDPVLTYAENVPGVVLEKMQNDWHPLHTAQYVFVKGHLQNLLLSNLGDRGEMSHSIEGRTPFLDHRLTQYVDSLPPSVKVRWCGENDGSGRGEWVEKWILREAARGFVRDEIRTKKKHPYSAPLAWKCGGKLYAMVRELVTVDSIEQLGFLDVGPEWLEELMLKAFTSADGTRAGEKMAFKTLVCLAQWVVLQKRFGVERFERNGVETLKKGQSREGENVMLG